MSSLTVRISTAAHKTLTELAQQSGESMQAVLDMAIEDYRRKAFLHGLAADFAALRTDPQAWAEEVAERQTWDAALLDGLEEDDTPPQASAANRSGPPRRRKKR